MSKLTTAQIKQVLKEIRSYCASNVTEYGGTCLRCQLQPLCYKTPKNISDYNIDDITKIIKKRNYSRHKIVNSDCNEPISELELYRESYKLVCRMLTNIAPFTECTESQIEELFINEVKSMREEIAND